MSPSGELIESSRELISKLDVLIAKMAAEKEPQLEVPSDA